MNIALKAEHPNSVIFDKEKRIFRAIFPNRSLSYQYKKGEDTLVLVEDSESETDQDQLIVGGGYEGNDTISLQVDGAAIGAQWFKDPYDDFGLYIPESMKTVKFEDGYEYATKDGQATLSILNSDQASTPYLRKEKDLSRYSEYIGSEFWGMTGLSAMTIFRSN